MRAPIAASGTQAGVTSKRQGQRSPAALPARSPTPHLLALLHHRPRRRQLQLLPPHLEVLVAAQLLQPRAQLRHLPYLGLKGALYLVDFGAHLGHHALRGGVYDGV